MIDKAKAVWTKQTEINQYIQARQYFETEICENAAIQISADTDYVLHINGEFVGCGGWRTFPPKRAYDEYEITNLLKNGKNEVFVTAYYQNKSSSTYCHGEPGVAFAIEIGKRLILSGEETEVRAHPYYKSGEMEMITGQLGYSFVYDASAAETEWEECCIKKDFFVQYFKRPVKKLELREASHTIKTCGVLKRESEDGTPAMQMQGDFLSFREPTEIFDNEGKLRYQKDGAYFVIDLGENRAGYFEMSLTADKGTVIDIGYGEHLEDMRVRTSVGGRNFAVRYIAKQGRQHFREYFKRFGCRYIEIHITKMKGDISFEKIGFWEAKYPLERCAQVEIDDRFFNKLYDVSVKTLTMCMHEHYEDCPWREQALYAYDSYVQMLCGYYAFGEYEFARASLELLAESRKPNGLLGLTAPGEASMTIPSFSLAWIMSLEKYVLFSGDVDFGKKYIETARKILDFFELHNGIVINKNGEEYWNFIEWSDGLWGDKNDDAPCDAATNFYYLLAVKAYNRLSGYCECAPYFEDTELIKKRIYEEFFDADTGYYVTRKNDSRLHELTQAFAIVSDMPHADDIAKSLTQKENGLVKVTLSTSMFKYDALLKYETVYAKYVLDDIFEVYSKMIFGGADTLWETSVGAADFENAGSLCHAWSAVPIYVLFKYYIGFVPQKPGFAQYALNPMKFDGNLKIKAQLLMPQKEIAIETKN